MNRIKTVAIVSVIACIVLAGGLVSVTLSLQDLIQQKDDDYSDLYFQLLNETRVAYEYWANMTGWRKTVWTPAKPSDINLTDQVEFLEQHTQLYEEIISGFDPGKLESVIVYVSEKNESENIHLPNPYSTYQKIRDGFAPYEVLMLPELKGNLNWTETFQWISTNFTGIPICLSVFEGGTESLPSPNVNLAVAEIQQAIEVVDVRMIRFAEMVSWHQDINASQTYQNVTFPTNDVRAILELCRSRNLRVLWSEWKISDDVLEILNSTIAGYEDIVTVMYQTNDEYHEPFVGFLYATQFEHWGASIQSWYWKEHLDFYWKGTSWYWKENTNETEVDMPVDLIREHTVLARNMGAEIIQFEPYWYFFDNDGNPLESMTALWAAI